MKSNFTKNVAPKVTPARELHFCSTLESNPAATPHDFAINLALDAALLHLNDQLPHLDAAASQLILDAAQAAATAVLNLCHVPDEWPRFVACVNFDTKSQVRSELWDIVLELMPKPARQIREQQEMAHELALRFARPERQDAMHKALFDLDNAYMGYVIESIYQAFKLGFELAHDPRRLIMEECK